MAEMDGFKIQSLLLHAELRCLNSTRSHVLRLRRLFSFRTFLVAQCATSAAIGPKRQDKTCLGNRMGKRERAIQLPPDVSLWRWPIRGAIKSIYV